MRRLLIVFLLVLLQVQPASAVTLTQFKIDFWADNWAVVYVNGIKVAQDPIPITTTKSFNKVSATFKATYPLTVAVMAKDYTENSSGLEYIGSSNQQIGDAGLIVQIHEAITGKFVLGTNQSWKSLVLFKAPLNPECVNSSQPLQDCKSMVTAAPANWYGTRYSDSKWISSTLYTEQQVGVKDGYNEVSWNQNAKLIWSKSLTLDNTVLFRATAKSALVSQGFSLVAPDLVGNQLKAINTCDGLGEMPALSWVNQPAATKSFLITMDTLPGPARPSESTQTDFNHLVVYNMSSSLKTLTASSAGVSWGKNFKGTIGYTPPCSQGPGLKTYTFHIYALSTSLTGANLTATEALAQAAGKILAETKLDLSYTRS